MQGGGAPFVLPDRQKIRIPFVQAYNPPTPTIFPVRFAIRDIPFTQEPGLGKFLNEGDTG